MRKYRYMGTEHQETEHYMYMHEREHNHDQPDDFGFGVFNRSYKYLKGISTEY